MMYCNYLVMLITELCKTTDNLNIILEFVSDGFFFFLFWFSYLDLGILDLKIHLASSEITKPQTKNLKISMSRKSVFNRRYGAFPYSFPS